MTNAFKLGISFLILIGSSTGFARTFYKSTVSLTVNYTQLSQATLLLLDEIQLEVHYSNDHDYCYLYVEDLEFECHSYHPEGESQQAQFTIDRPVAGEIISAALGQNQCTTEIHEAFIRLSTYLSDTIDVEHSGANFYQQIHDEVPEAFHIWLFDLSAGIEY